MKTLKWLTICLVLFCSSSVFAQCVVGIAPSISGEIGFCGSGVPANQAKIGDTIVYSVLIETSGAACPISNAVASLTLPDGTVIPVPVTSDLPPGSSESFPCIASYVVAPGDLGQLAVDISPLGTDPTQPNEVRALVIASGTADTGGGNTDEANGAAVRTTTIVPEPCVDITKEACGYSKAGDTITYTYSIQNCTIPVNGGVGPDLLLVSVVDDVLGDITADALAACGPILIWGAPACEFTVDYPVTVADEPGPIVNIVTVNALYEATGESATDDATATVELLHPCFNMSAACDGIDGDTGYFTVTFSNCGDVALNILPDDTNILPFTLGVGETVDFPSQAPATGDCFLTTSQYISSATGTIPPEFCELPNIIDPNDGPAQAVCEVPGNPSFTVEKSCISTEPLTAGDIAQYEIIITNTGDVPLDFEINDAAAEPPIVGTLVGPIAPAADAPANVYSTTVSITVPDCNETGVDYLLNNLVSVEGFCGDGTSLGIQEASADCTYSCEPEGGEEGCTPGFWKNHPECWCDSYAPEMLVSDVWTALQDPNYASYSDSKCDFDTDTLMDALNYKGGRGLEGAVRNLLRHATAALLNGCNADVAFPVSDALVIELGNAALASEDVDIIQELHSVLAEFNEYGCPIDAHCNLIIDDPNDLVVYD